MAPMAAQKSASALAAEHNGADDKGDEQRHADVGAVLYG